MKKFYILSLSLALFFLLGAARPNNFREVNASENRKGELSTRENQSQTKKYDTPTSAVKTFFTAFRDKDFDLAWESLTLTSQNQFVKTFAANRKISFAKAQELFEKDKETVRLQFWNSLRDRSKVVPLVQDAVYTLTDQKGNEAMVEMKSGGIANHVKAIKEGKEWKLGYTESGLQEDQPLTPPPPPPRPETTPAPPTSP